MKKSMARRWMLCTFPTWYKRDHAVYSWCFWFRNREHPGMYIFLVSIFRAVMDWNFFLVHQVSWVRSSDSSILSVGNSTFIQDGRFRVIHSHDSEVWGLQITKVRQSDAGPYECQISSEPKKSFVVELKVVGKTPYTHTGIWCASPKRPDVYRIYFAWLNSISHALAIHRRAKKLKIVLKNWKESIQWVSTCCWDWRKSNKMSARW